jgi:hypothetical protein
MPPQTLVHGRHEVKALFDRVRLTDREVASKDNQRGMVRQGQPEKRGHPVLELQLGDGGAQVTEGWHVAWLLAQPCPRTVAHPKAEPVFTVLH